MLRSFNLPGEDKTLPLGSRIDGIKKHGRPACEVPSTAKVDVYEEEDFNKPLPWRRAWYWEFCGMVVSQAE
jgi:hypothetical protein